MLGVRAARPRRCYRYPDVGEQLVRGESGRVEVDEKVGGGNCSPTRRPNSDERCVESQHHRWEVRRRIGVGDATTDRSAVTHLWITDVRRGVGQAGCGVANVAARRQLGVRRHCANHQRGALPANAA